MEKYGLIGGSLSHSMSPFIHEQLFKLSGRNAEYKLYEVESVSEFVKKHPNMDGYSVTIPHKEECYRSAVGLHKSALPYGAVNCVDAKGVGYNTDVDGFRMSVKEIIDSFDIKVLLLGFGGVGKMIAKQFNPSKLTIAMRNTSAESIKSVYNLVGNNVTITTFDKIPQKNFDLIVNSTPIGMFPNTSDSPVSDDVVSKCKAVYDTVYNPLKTQLILQGEKHSIKVKGGLDMLVFQAMVAHLYWYDGKFDLHDVMKIAMDVEDILMQKE